MEQIQQERKRLQYNKRYSSTLKSTVAVLIVVAALAILVATLWMDLRNLHVAGPSRRGICDCD